MSAETIEVLTGPDFLTGLFIGLLLLVAVAVVARPDQKGFRSLTIGGLALAAGTMVALTTRTSIPVALWIGVVALGVAGIFPVARWVAGILALPGAWVVAYATDLEVTGSLKLFLLVAIALAAPIIADFDDHHQVRSLGLPLLSITILGVFFTLPDTEHAVILFGVVIPLAFLGWPRPLARLGAPGSFATIGVLMWVIAADGLGRPSSVIGATAALGILLAEPVGRRVCEWLGHDHHRQTLNAIIIGGLQLIVVLIASRLAGVMPHVWQASALVLLLLAVTAALAPSLKEDSEGIDTPDRRAPP